MDEKKKNQDLTQESPATSPDNKPSPPATASGTPSVLGGKAPEYKSTWKGQMQDILTQIQDRKPFEYDMNNDALYNMYKDSAIAGGRLAMEDTIGKGAALTGGYGNSYVNQAGQQAYQAQLQSVNDRLPQLMDMALQMYDRDGARLNEQMGLLGNMEALDYGQFMDQQNLGLATDELELEKQQGAFDRIVAMMQLVPGYTPTPEELAMSGINPSIFAPAAGGSDSGSGGGWSMNTYLKALNNSRKKEKEESSTPSAADSSNGKAVYVPAVPSYVNRYKK